MTTQDSATPNPSAARWQNEMVALLAEIEAARTPAAEARVLARVAGLDPDPQRFLVERMTEQESPEAAACLDALAAHPATPDAARAQARGALSALAERGIAVPATGVETYHAGWVQQGRERGEQIMLLGWRLADGRIEGLVFLLDWRGDGLKDFYRTRDLGDAEWRELVEHNAKKGAPLTEIALAEGRALLEEALADGRRFSRPVPREYRLAQALVTRRIIDVAALPTTPRQYVSPDLTPIAVVEAYIQALHFRDCLLAWDLLAPEHPARAPERSAGVELLRRHLKHGPRRLPDAQVAIEGESSAAGAERTSVLAEGQEETVDKTGRRTRHPVRERYHLRRTPDGWRITAIAAL